MTDTPAERGAESTWTRLRRRKVVQWGVVYVAAAWGFLQGLEYVTETFQWPVQLRQVSFLALLIGLPVVLVLAWYHGDRGQQRVSTPEFAILTLLLLLGGGAFWYYQRASETPTGVSTTAQPAAPAALPLEVAAAPHEKSIAVLPFADMSAAKDQEYMSDGIAEELLNLLARVPDLKVIARTSSFAFKGEKVPIEEIAKKLNVAHILEGSVRTSGDTIRVTAQLIHAADSTHLWSETYDRQLEDIFAIQDEIAGAIAQTLQIKLKGGEISRHEGGTQSLEAFDLYLRAGWATDKNTEASINRAGEYLEQAIKLDPSYGRAWLRLAGNFSLKADSAMLSPTDGYERARRLALHALQLSPSLAAEVHSWLQYFHIVLDWDWAAAEREGQLGLAIDPNNPSVLESIGILSRTLGHWDEAERNLRAVLIRDPLNPYSIWNLATVYYNGRRYAEAETLYRKILEVSPSFTWARNYLGKTLVALGKPEAALKVLEGEADEGSRLVILPVALLAAGRKIEADEALQAQIAYWAETGAYIVAMTYAHRGDNDLAVEWLDRAYRQKDPMLFELVGEPLLNNIADDPRFIAFLRKMKLPEWPTQATAAAGK